MAELFPDDEEFREQKIAGKDFNGLIIENKEFDSCIFTGCQMAETGFRYCHFHDCIFEQCDLSLAHFDHCYFQNTIFRKTRLVGIDWTKLEWRKNTLQPIFHFHQCNLSYGNFFGCLLKGCTFLECMLQEADFAEADLSAVNCQHSDFSKARFLHTNLTDADFIDAQQYNINAATNVLKRTKFNLPEAVALLHSLDIILEE